MPKGLLLMMTDIDPPNEEDFNRWYEEEHLVERMAIPGFINARRFTALEGGPKYLALYDLESPEVLQSAPYRHIVGPASRRGPSAWRASSRISAAMCMCPSVRGSGELSRVVPGLVPGTPLSGATMVPSLSGWPGQARPDR